MSLDCHHCGARFRQVELHPGECARCDRCDSVLDSYSSLKPSHWLALVLATFIIFVIANAYPIATLTFQGLSQSARFIDAVIVTLHDGYWEVATVTFFVAFLLPFLHMLLLVWLLAPMALGRQGVGMEAGLMLYKFIKPWSMVPVLLMGIIVTIVKMAGMATFIPGIGLVATALTAVMITLLSQLDHHRLQLMLKGYGVRFSEKHHAKPPSVKSINKTWALLATAIILYIPANVLPIMQITTFGQSTQHTIMGGVIELVNYGSWDLAAIIFIASILVPTAKIIILGTLVWLTQQRSNSNLKQRTRYYKFVEFVGQWSMIDVFVVILLCALGQFGAVLSIQPNAGVVAFAGVVVLTMVAAMGFDPRLAWRRAGHFATFRTSMNK
jgi:paraquat-inducible protein A